MIYTVYEGSSGKIELLTKCNLQEGTVTKNFFIRPELTTFFRDDKENEMWDQFFDASSGQRWDQPLYFIQNAFALVSDKNQMYLDLSERFFELDG